MSLKIFLTALILWCLALAVGFTKCHDKPEEERKQILEGSAWNWIFRISSWTMLGSLIAMIWGL